jgi:hypothetical protein
MDRGRTFPRRPSGRSGAAADFADLETISPSLALKFAAIGRILEFDGNFPAIAIEERAWH